MKKLVSLRVLKTEEDKEQAFRELEDAINKIWNRMDELGANQSKLEERIEALEQSQT